MPAQRIGYHPGIVVGFFLEDDATPSNTGSDLVNLTNGNTGTIPIGTPVYSSSNGAFDEARANASGTSLVIGITSADVAPGATNDVVTSGPIEATKPEWDAIAGTSGGLAFNTVYYLDPSTAGKLTATAPSGAGQFVVQVGIAVSTTVLVVSREPPIGPI